MDQPGLRVLGTEWSSRTSSYYFPQNLNLDPFPKPLPLSHLDDFASLLPVSAPIVDSPTAASGILVKTEIRSCPSCALNPAMVPILPLSTGKVRTVVPQPHATCPYYLSCLLPCHISPPAHCSSHSGLSKFVCEMSSCSCFRAFAPAVPPDLCLP